MDKPFSHVCEAFLLNKDKKENILAAVFLVMAVELTGLITHQLISAEYTT